MIISRSLGSFALAWSLTVVSIQAANTVAVNEVLKLKNAGLAEDTILAFIQSKNINYDLTSDDAISLGAKVSPAVLNAMLSSGRGAPVTYAPPPAVPNSPGVPNAPVAQPAPVYGTPQPQPQVVVQPSVAGQPTVVVQPAFNPDDAYFRQELSPHGRWILVDDGQWYWQPTIVITQRTWRPYWDGGQWVNTDHGWYWSSDYPWGWATFHYGRWQLHPHHGWIWYPGRTWGPAWVVWRGGGDYCGWAPLPPHADFDFVSGSFSFNGRHVDASFDFGLDFNHFSFSFVKELGDRPRSHFRQPEEARRVYNQTTIINNYTVNRTVVNNNVNIGGESRGRIVNRGIDPARVSAARGKVVEEVKIRDLGTPSPTRKPEHLDVQAKTLEVYRPKLPEQPPRTQYGGRPGTPGNPGGRPDQDDNRRGPDRGPDPKRRP